MTVVLTPDTSGAPFVLVEIDSPPVGAETVTVRRTTGGREMEVRGMINVPADGASALDYEAGTGWGSSYRPQYFDADGIFLEYGDPEVVSLPANPGSVAWVHNPFDPTTSVQVTMRDTAANVLRRPVSAQSFRPRGRSAKVSIFGTRSGLEGVSLDCASLSLADADRFDALFGGYDDDSTIPILCFRTNPGMRLPPTLFAQIPDPQQLPLVRMGVDEVDWKLTGDEAAPPAGALVLAVLSYEDFTVFYSAVGDEDYDEFTAAYADYTAAQRDYSIAGTA